MKKTLMLRSLLKYKKQRLIDTQLSTVLFELKQKSKNYKWNHVRSTFHVINKNFRLLYFLNQNDRNKNFWFFLNFCFLELLISRSLFMVSWSSSYRDSPVVFFIKFRIYLRTLCNWHSKHTDIGKNSTLWTMQHRSSRTTFHEHMQSYWHY